MKKSAEFFHLQWTHLAKTSLPPAAALLVLWNPIWRIWGNSIPVLPYVLSQLQRELLWRRKPPMSTLFPVLCSAEFSSLGKQPRILPKSTFFCVCSECYPRQVKAWSSLSQIQAKNSLGLPQGQRSKGWCVFEGRGGEVAILVKITLRRK